MNFLNTFVNSYAVVTIKCEYPTLTLLVIFVYTLNYIIILYICWLKCFNDITILNQIQILVRIKMFKKMLILLRRRFGK